MKNFFYSLKFVILLWVAIFIAWGFTMIYEWHFYYWWVDMILHFSGGFWIMVLSRYIIEHYKIEINGVGKKLVKFVVFVSFVALVGVLWEFYEFVLDRYITMSGFTYLARAFEDTLSDLALDILGGITAFLLYFKNGKA